MFRLLAHAQTYSICTVPTEFSFPTQRFFHSCGCLTNMFPFNRESKKERWWKRWRRERRGGGAKETEGGGGKRWGGEKQASCWCKLPVEKRRQSYFPQGCWASLETITELAACMCVCACTCACMCVASLHFPQQFAKRTRKRDGQRKR